MPDNVPEIVITGCGWVTPFASGTVQDVLAALGSPDVAGTATRAPVLAPDGHRYLSVPDSALLAFPNISKEIRQDKGAWMTAVAIEYAFQDAHLDRATIAPERLGMILGCALAGQTGMIQFASEVREQSARFVSPINFPQTVGNFIAGAIARGYDVRGPNLTLAAGAASGLDAVCEAAALFRSRRADVILAGGTEAFTDTLAAARTPLPPRAEGDQGGGEGCPILATARVGDGLASGGMAERSAAMRPLDDRPAEGACWFILERAADAAKRGVRILATILSWKHGADGPLQEVPDRCHPAYQPPIVSTAGLRVPAATYIQDQIGFCPGASGASALAAALASPITKGGPTGVPVRILAGDARSHFTSLDLHLH